MQSSYINQSWIGKRDNSCFAFSYNDILGVFNEDDVIEFLCLEIDREDCFGGTLLSTAVERDNLGLCAKVLARGADPDVPLGFDSLVLAVQSEGENSLAIFKAMLPFSKKGIYDFPRIGGGALLQEAVRMERMDIAEFLFQNGSSLEEMDIDCNPVWAHALDVGGEPYLAKLEALLPADSSWQRPASLEFRMRGPIYS
jgi:hypothetical protein